MPLKLVKRPKSPNWIIRGTLRGIRVEESTGTPDKRAAEETRAKREAEILRESIYGRAATMSSPRPRSASWRKTGAGAFVMPLLDYFGTTPLRPIGQEAIDNAALKLYPKASNATKNRQVYTPVSAILQHAARKGWCPRPLFSRPKMSKAAVRWLKPDEAERLIAACSPHLQPLVISLLYTGARIGEALWLDWSNVDLERRHVTFPKTKNGEARGVPFAHPCCRGLGSSAEQKGSGVPGSQWCALRSARCPATTATRPQVPGSRKHSQVHAEGRRSSISRPMGAGIPGPHGTTAKTAT